MATNELRQRTNWQTASGALALNTEDIFTSVLQDALNSAQPQKFLVDRRPPEFNDIYSKVSLNEETLNAIYNIDVHAVTPNKNLKYKWGISMDFAIRNLQNGKVLFGEIKRQDGWIERTSPSAGRGNAHERCCKYFTPGLNSVLRQASGLATDILPFWIIFVGDITRDPKRNREIAFWFQGYEKNFFMWRDTKNVGALLDFFENNLLPYLL